MFAVTDENKNIIALSESPIEGYLLFEVASELLDFGIDNLCIVDGSVKRKPVELITPRQARLKLLEVGLLDELEAIITANRAWQIEWEYATEVKRDSPLIDAVASEAGLTSEQVDTMFLEASQL